MHNLPKVLANVLDAIPQRDIEQYLDHRKGEAATRRTVCLAQLCHKNPQGDREIHPKKCLGCNDLVVQN